MEIGSPYLASWCGLQKVWKVTVVASTSGDMIHACTHAGSKVNSSYQGCGARRLRLASSRMHTAHTHWWIVLQ